MPCLDITLPGTLSNAAALPLAYDDAMITAGTLMLWEPGHPVAPFAGVPTAPAVGAGTSPVTTSMPNIAQTAARNLLGNQSADVSVPFYRDDGCNTAGTVNTDFGFERSAKGGLHIAASQATMHSYRSVYVGMPDALESYILANPTHEYYVSVWRRITRVALTQSVSAPVHYIGRNSGASDIIMNQGDFALLGNAAVNHSAVSSFNALGNEISQIANNWDYGTLPVDISAMLARFGTAWQHPSYGDQHQNKAASAIYYRIFVEDLTASGRSWATVKALDDAKYAAAFASGGRYYGDTFTAAATLMA